MLVEVAEVVLTPDLEKLLCQAILLCQKMLNKVAELGRFVTVNTVNSNFQLLYMRLAGKLYIAKLIFTIFTIFTMTKNKRIKKIQQLRLVTVNVSCFRVTVFTVTAAGVGI